MPRRHPKQDEDTSSKSAEALAERRAARARKRSRKSPPDHKRGGLLTYKEVNLLRDEVQALKRSDSENRDSLIRNVESELIADSESLSHSRSDFFRTI